MLAGSPSSCGARPCPSSTRGQAVLQQHRDLGSLRAGPRQQPKELQEETSAEEEHAESYEESLSEDLRSLANQIVGRSGCAEHPSSWRRWP